MNLKAIRDARSRHPFVPFDLRLADGRSLPVPHPDFLLVTERIVIVAYDDGSWKAVEPLLIVSVDYPPTKPQRNGSGRKRRRPPEQT